MEVTHSDDADYAEYGRIELRADKDAGLLEIATHQDIYRLDKSAALKFAARAIREANRL